MSYPKYLTYLVLCFTFCLSCNQNGANDIDVERIYNSLHENEARILFQINGKEFYTSESIFEGEIAISRNSFSMKLRDQFDSQTMINFEEQTWYSNKPIKRQVFGNDQVGVGLKTGKIVDRDRMIGEGYVMSQGYISIPEFHEDKMIFTISGKVGKYSDFQEPEKYVPIEGWIIYKKPLIKFDGITEKDVFSPTGRQ